MPINGQRVFDILGVPPDFTADMSKPFLDRTVMLVQEQVLRDVKGAAMNRRAEPNDVSLSDRDSAGILHSARQYLLRGGALLMDEDLDGQVTARTNVVFSALERLQKEAEEAYDA